MRSRISSARINTPRALRAILSSPVAWALSATAFAAFRMLNSSLGDLVSQLGDSDDATRLIAVRDLLSGAPWFDTTLPRLGGDTPYISHWSRLIDLPLAVLLAVFGLALAPPQAELAMRILWPTIVLAVFLTLLARQAALRRGPAAAAIVLFLSVCATTGLGQFSPGRIDHHNVQITCAVIGLLMLARSLDTPRAGWGAGAALGLGIAIGYEAIILVAIGCAAAAVIAAFDRRAIAGVSHATTSFALTLAGCILLTVPPSHWLRQTCDALSSNILLAAAAGAAGMAAIKNHWDKASHSPALQTVTHQATGSLHWSPLASRLGLLLVTGGAAGLAYVAADPVCLAGPFAQVDPAIKPIWLDDVTEAQPILWLFGSDPPGFLAFIAFGLTGLVSAGLIWKRNRTADALFFLILAGAGLGLAIWQMKLVPYATWLLLLPIALMLRDVPSLPRQSKATTRLALLLLINQSALTFAASAAIAVTGLGARAASAGGTDQSPVILQKSCLTNAAIDPLGKLPTGRFAGEIDVGSFIVARTQHSVIAAPYHRLDRQILATHALFQAPPAQALVMAKAMKADYLVACISSGEIAAGGKTGDNPEGLRSKLRAGEQITGFEAIALTGTPSALRVWRVRHGSSGN
jgi:hypothetical protein